MTEDEKDPSELTSFQLGKIKNLSKKLKIHVNQKDPLNYTLFCLIEELNKRLTVLTDQADKQERIIKELKQVIDSHARDIQSISHTVNSLKRR